MHAALAPSSPLDAASLAPERPFSLPPLREELALLDGPAAYDGAPTWSLHDPVRNQFYRIDWPTFEVLARWHLGNPARIVEAIEAETTLSLSEEDVEVVIRFLAEHQLVRPLGEAGTARLVQQEKARHSTLWQWLLHHYLFFRIPLLRPDRWLVRQLPRVEMFYSRTFLYITLAALTLGLFQVARQWDHFAATLVDTFSWRGALGYGVALTLVKVLHEFGHAFTARRLGCRVPTMGVAFLVMWPVAYTDVNEAWRLTRRQDRLAVGAAGILTELAIAAWATLAWTLLPDGTLRGTVFMLATTTWVATLAINASPFMRFDGYFLLSDFLDFPNLHPRSFALARWDLRERLFALGEPIPECLPPARQRGLILFAYGVWLYRLTLFVGIALLVYHYFFKALGILLFAVEIGWFVILPIWREIGEWKRRWPQIKTSRGSRGKLWLLAVLAFIFVVPWNLQVSSQGLMRSARHYPLFAPGPATIAAMPVKPGQAVPAGQVLMKLDAVDAKYRQRLANARVSRLAWQAEVSGLDENLRARQPITVEELEAARAELAGANDELQRYTVTAPFPGVLADLSPDLRVGESVGRQQQLGVFIDPTAWVVETYLTDAEVERIAVGASGRFLPETPGLPALALKVASIDRDATRALPDAMLAAGHGGEVLVRERNNQLIPERAVYRVVLAVEEAAPAQARVLRGSVVIYGRPKSLVGDFLRSGAALAIREAGW